jgi:hypothetical protein
VCCSQSRAAFRLVKETDREFAPFKWRLPRQAAKRISSQHFHLA